MSPVRFSYRLQQLKILYIYLLIKIRMESKTFAKKIEDFTCKKCGTKNKGTGYTDHCFNCLWGKHVDINPGDRMSKCHGLMKPTKAMHDRNEFLIVYECTKCKIK